MTMFAMMVLGVAIGASPTASPAPVPCGYVEFKPAGPPRIVEGTFYERMTVSVHFADGHTESATLPYLWSYPDGEKSDPWSDANVRRAPYLPIRFQFPPAGFDRRALPPLIAYVIDHSDPQGYTDLPACPTETSRQATTLVSVEVPAAARIDARPFFDQLVSGAAGPVKDCVWFTNQARIAATRVVFELRYFDAQRATRDRLSIEARGRFEPGVENGSPWRLPEEGGYCGPRPRSVMDVAGKGVIAAVVLAVRSIDYDDGTSWRAPATSLPITTPR